MRVSDKPTLRNSLSVATRYETAEHYPLRKRGSRVKWLIFINIVG